MFDSIAPGYDRLNHILSLDVDRLWRRRAVKEAVCGGTTEVLDVACGTGDMAIALAKALPSGGKVTGVDISEGMLLMVAEKARRAGVGEKVSVETGDGEDLRYGDGSFDCVTCAFGIRNFENREAGLREFLRVLRPGGKLVILELSVPRNKLMLKIYDLYFKYILPRVGGKLSGDKAAYRYLPASVHAFPSPEEFCDCLRKAGFVNVKSKGLSLGLCRLFTGEAGAQPVGHLA